MKRSRISHLILIVFFVASTDVYGQNKLLRELAKEGQDARTGKPVTRTDEERIRITLDLIARAELKNPEDKFNAGLILQHTGVTFCDKRLVSISPYNYLLAHNLFTSAFEAGYKEARYLVAASIDRYLTFTQGYQKYGTNRIFNQETGKEELVPIDRKTSDSERAKYGVPSLSELLRQYPEQAP